MKCPLDHDKQNKTNQTPISVELEGGRHNDVHYYYYYYYYYY